ncbi:MAG: indolepyruvate oxidoreductase subunit beta family protein [Proteobacteria bacterium]|nr:indolepyruvate oxidoreductase subunit beta family protein [Pseudomonadota bacterium]
MAERTIKLSVAALGGQGGGVLTDWLIAIAEANGYIVQSTSVPGVAQRTGATIYYLEFFPREQATRAGREPIMALMPVAGDVDCVVASELAEAGRAVQRGLVNPERTTLIASTHRTYAIAEKSAMGDGAPHTAELLDLLRGQGQRTILFDMEAAAERHHSLISAVLLGAICGAGVLPFPRGSFEEAIRAGGLAVKTNLAAFGDALEIAQRGGESPPQPAAAAAIPERAQTPALQPLLERIRRLPPAARATALEGARRCLDYQDARYAALYLERLEAIVALDRDPEAALSEATARALALWMSFEDTLRVAQLKTRGTRLERVRSEVRADAGQLLDVTEFMKPRIEEIAGTLPAGMGRRVLASARLRAWLSRFTGGRQIHTTHVGGFVLLYLLGALRRFRRGTLRYQEEDARIRAWLARIAELAPAHYALAVEVARLQRLVKGYGETHERGWRNFSALVGELDRLAARSDGADTLARLQAAALADEEGTALRRELAALAAG